jgi:non-specific serine/threonine protein kinase/serine/threonine-protein kinase
MKNTAGDRAVRAASASELRGDLDWITMRALEKDRTRRYGSASDLAADLRRHLDNLPVLASPPSTVYRVRKFARRHRIGVVFAAATVALLVALAATMTVQARRIALERDRANRETAAAKAVAEFLVGLFKVSDPGEARGNTLTAREVLDTGAKQLTETLAGQPELQARLQETIATVYTNLGLYAAAEPLLARALATDTRVLGVHDLQTLSALNALATVTWFRGRFDEAERLYRQVVEQRTYSLGTTHRDTLKAQFDLASTLLVQERWTEFEKLATTVLDAQRQSLGRDDPDTLESLNNLQNYYFHASVR